VSPWGCQATFQPKNGRCAPKDTVLRRKLGRFSHPFSGWVPSNLARAAHSLPPLMCAGIFQGGPCIDVGNGRDLKKGGAGLKMAHLLKITLAFEFWSVSP
jgi:hypothetical protein